MQGVVATRLHAIEGRKGKDVQTDFFLAKVQALLLRTHNVIRVLPDEVKELNVQVLNQFSNVGSVDEVLAKLGGETALAARVFMSVMDEAEKHELEFYSKKRVVQRQQLVMQELEALVVRVQSLARQLQPVSSPLVMQVLALKLPQSSIQDDDVAGTGDQESRTEVSAKKTKKNAAAAANSPKPKSKTKATLSKKRERQAMKETEPKKSSKMQKALELSVQSGPRQFDQQCLEEDGEAPVIGRFCEADVNKLLAEAELEFAEVYSLGSGGTALVAAVDVPIAMEAAPNVERVAADASLNDLTCLRDHQSEVGVKSLEGRVSLQMWWRVAKRSGQIYGVFQLMRSMKSHITTLPGRYTQLTEKIESALSFIQASK